MNKLLLYALAASLSLVAHAQDAQQAEGETKMKIEDAANKKNKVEGDIDQEITNAKLRADTGSKSRYSLSLTAQYLGGSIKEPFSKDRPNVTNDPIAPKVSMGGDFGGRYRIDKNQSLSLTLGYSLERPFHEAQRGQISNPSVNYNYASKIGLVQSVSTAGLTASTNSDERTVGQMGSVAASNTLIYDFGGTRTSLGLATEASYTTFSKEDEIVEPKGQKAKEAINFQQDFGLAAYPFAEYAFSDSVNLRTVFRPWIFSHNRTAEGWTFEKRPWTQSLGVGFAVTRDIYLYPNFQWDWERWRRDDFNWFKGRTARTSTVGLSATVNLF